MQVAKKAKVWEIIQSTGLKARRIFLSLVPCHWAEPQASWEMGGLTVRIHKYRKHCLQKRDIKEIDTEEIFRPEFGQLAEVKE